MVRSAARLAAELLPVALVLACLVGSVGLVTAVYRRRSASIIPPTPAPAPAQAEEPIPAPPKPVPVPAAEPAEEVKDPTPEALAALSAQQIEHRSEAEKADKRAQALENARKTALGSIAKLKRDESSVLAKADDLSQRARRLEEEVEALEIERDILAQEKEAAKAARARAEEKAKSGFSIRPYKGPNGTWRRPIPIECSDGTVKVQPDGPTFSMLDLSAIGGMRSHPLVRSVAAMMMKVQEVAAPDGSPMVPYILFLIRPDGVRPYYEARARLEPLGIAFGYELVDQDWEIDYPEIDDLPKASPPSGRRSTDDVPRWPDLGTSPPLPRDVVEVDGDDLFPRGRPIVRGTGGAEPFDPRPRRTHDRELTFGDGSGGFGNGSEEESAMGRGPGRSDASGRGMAEGRGQGLPPLRGPRPPDRNLPILGASGAGSGGSEGLAASSERGSPLAGGMSGTVASSRTSPSSGLGTGLRGGVPLEGGMSGTAASSRTSPSSGLRAGLRGGDPLSSSDKLGAPSGDGIGIGTGLGAPSPRLSDSDRLAGVPGGSQGSTPGRPPGGTGTASASGTASAAGSASARATASAAGSASAGGSGSVAGSGTSRQGGAGVDLRPRRKLQLVLACGPKGVVIHPGGYRMTSAALTAKGDALMTELRAIVAAKRTSEPEVDWRPELRFLVEPGGNAMYWNARRQTVLGGAEWPFTIQVANSDSPRLINTERR